MPVFRTHHSPWQRLDEVDIKIAIDTSSPEQDQITAKVRLEHRIGKFLKRGGKGSRRVHLVCQLEAGLLTPILDFPAGLLPRDYMITGFKLRDGMVGHRQEKLVDRLGNGKPRHRVCLGDGRQVRVVAIVAIKQPQDAEHDDCLDGNERPHRCRAPQIPIFRPDPNSHEQVSLSYRSGSIPANRMGCKSGDLVPKYLSSRPWSSSA